MGLKMVGDKLPDPPPQGCRYDGDYKKRESGFYWDYRKYVGIPEGLRKMKQKAVGIL